jgi:selenide,water dikinase
MSGPPRRLTDYANCAGCAGKIAPKGLAQVMRGLPARPDDPALLVGPETFDDAGVYRVADDMALVQTLDFFPPLIDDPFVFGQIAAANALSDVYAMNGRPLTVMNIVAFPDDELPMDLLGTILRGSADRVAQAGALTLGGHSLRDTGIKFGLSVTGLVDPAELLTNAGASPGARLVLTKPLGTGFVTTAHKKQQCPGAVLEYAVAGMIQLNAIGRDALRASGGAQALTDITGFGLAVHALEMAEASGVAIEIDVDALPLIEGVEELATPRYFTRASVTNREYAQDRLRIEPDTDPLRVEFAFDAQTSGGLLIAVAEDHAAALVAELLRRGARAAAMIGRIVERTNSPPLTLRRGLA